MSFHHVPRKFEAYLTGSQEVPPNDTEETGKFRAVLFEHDLEYRLLVRGITGLTQAHLHLGQPGHVGPLVAFLYGLNAPSGHLNTVVLGGNITSENLIGPLSGHPLSDLVKEISCGNVYVDVHSNERPDGRIRGQVKIHEEECAKEASSKSEEEKEHKFPWNDKYEDKKEKKKGGRDLWEEDEDHKKTYPYPWEEEDESNHVDEKKEKKHKYVWENDGGWPWNENKEEGGKDDEKVDYEGERYKFPWKDEKSSSSSTKNEKKHRKKHKHHKKSKKHH